MTTLVEAKLAINDRFIAAWEGKTPYTIDNEDFTEPEGEAWVRLTVRNIGGGGQTSLGKVGNRRFDRKGIISVSVFTPIEQGTSEGDELAEFAKDLFEATRFNGVTAKNGLVKEKGSDNTWFQHIMKVEFEYYEIK